MREIDRDADQAKDDPQDNDEDGALAGGTLMGGKDSGTSALTPTLSPGERESGPALLESCCVVVAISATSPFDRPAIRNTIPHKLCAAAERFPLSSRAGGGVHATADRSRNGQRPH